MWVRVPPSALIIYTIMTKKNYKNSNSLKIIPLGGLEEVGRNMTLLEYGNDIMIVDMGLQFPEEDMPGIDYIIPNISYLTDKINKIRGAVITHGHYDHIGAIPHIMKRIGNPRLFTGKLTARLIKRRNEEFKKNPPLKITEIDEDSKIELGKSFKVTFLRVNHSIPDCFAVIIETPVGRVIHTGDFKIDYSPVNDKPADLHKIAHIGGKGVLLLMSDSTDATLPGYQISESAIGEEIGNIFDKIGGRIVIATFASQINRIQKIFDLAEKYNRKICLQGRSMNSNVKIARKIGYLKFDSKILVHSRDVRKLPNNQVIIMGTGAQGEENAFLMRFVNGEHRDISLKKGDTVIFSSSVIPGNERTIQSLKDIIVRQGAKVIHYQMMDVHAGGHAKQEELKLMMRLLKPTYFMPIEANYYMLQAHAELAEQVGISKENIFVASNGQIIKFFRDSHNQIKGKLTKNFAQTDYVMVDGLGVGDVGEIVLRDRNTMSRDGMFVIVATIDLKTHRVKESIDIISRGFVYLKESKELLNDTRALTSKLLNQELGPKKAINPVYLKGILREKIGQFLFERTRRRPIVLPVIMEI